MNGLDSTWHVEPEMLKRYRDDRLDAAAAFSVEAHLVECVACRNAAAPMVSPARLDGVWDEIVDRLDAPEPTLVERLLVRIGVREEVARLLAGVPALTLPWLSGVVLVLGFAAFAAHTRPSATAFFLATAAILPLMGIATAYGPGIDPMYEVGIAAPFRGMRLLLVRALAVLAVSTALSAVAALALPTLSWSAVAWLLPSLALTLLGVATGTFGAPMRSAVLVAGGWLVLVTAVAASDRGLGSLFGEAGQIVALAVASVSVLGLFARRERIERPGDTTSAGWMT